MTDEAEELPTLGDVTTSLQELLDMYEARYILGSQSDELDVLSWSNGIEVLLTKLMTHIGTLTLYTVSRGHDA